MKWPMPRFGQFLSVRLEAAWKVFFWHISDSAECPT
jgi:hypothetical protein